MKFEARMRTIPELVDDAASEFGDSTWLLSDDTTWSFANLRSTANGVAAAAADRGLGRGDLVLLVAQNTPRHVLTWLGLMDRGVLMLPVNPKSTVEELTGFMVQVQPAAVVHAGVSAVAPAVEAAGIRTQVIALDDLFAGGPSDSDCSRVYLRPTDPAVLIPTSGTTGRSKLVTQTHRGYVMAAEGFPWWLGLDCGDRMISALPLFHINIQAYSLLASLVAGNSLALIERFSASGFLEATRRFGATQFNSIGSMLELLMLQPWREDDADNPLRLCYTAPSPPGHRQLEIEKRFGIKVVCGYGMSETPYGLIWPRGERPFGTMGRERQHPTLGRVNEARVMVEGRQARIGEVGELELRNPAVMLDYYGMPEETAEVLVDGWLRTGDLVTKDGAGLYTFVARKKEVIRRRGENLAPGEVEEAIAAHPDVVAVAVVGVPAELGEEDVKAFVVAPAGVTLDLAEVRASLVGRLSPFKVPRYLEQVDRLPLTPTGRVAKSKLTRDRTAAERDFEGVPAARAGGAS